MKRLRKDNFESRLEVMGRRKPFLFSTRSSWLLFWMVLLIPYHEYHHHHYRNTNISIDALVIPHSTNTRNPSNTAAVLSPLFIRPKTTTNRWESSLERKGRFPQTTTATTIATVRTMSTALNMVLTTPESIIEQASTINLLDDLIDESVRTSPRRPIMMQFDPSSGWIWRRWKGTIFSETWRSCVRKIIYASLVFLIYKKYPGVKDYLNGFGTLWGQLLSVTTFTLTFFVNQSYALWRKCYELSRRLQGRLHDIGMNLATHATRKVPSTPEETSTYTASSRQILELMSRYIRLFDLLTYASFTRSHRPILTPRGMRRLVERGLMTAQERQVLVDAAIPATQRHSAILMWMMRLFVEGRSSGHIQGGDGFEQQTLEKFHIIRAQYGAIGDELQGRMPLAYAHVVQILVDLILWMYPIMAFSIGMSPLVAIAGTGLLTFSYQGLFDLAKQFLDPYDNENYGKGDDPLSVDTLIAETNAGSVRWMYGFEEMPFSPEKVKDGELHEYRLPVRGYTVEELVYREREAEEQRIHDEQERSRREEEEEEEEEAARNRVEESYEEAFEDSVEFDGDSGEGVGDDLEGINSISADSIVETPNEVISPVHKVFTLANGTVVSFTGNSDVVTTPDSIEERKLGVSSPAIPKGSAAYYLASLSRQNSMATDVPTIDVVPPIPASSSTLPATESPLDTSVGIPILEEGILEDEKSLLTPKVADQEVEDKEDMVVLSLNSEKELEGEISFELQDIDLEVVSPLTGTQKDEDNQRFLTEKVDASIYAASTEESSPPSTPVGVVVSLESNDIKEEVVNGAFQKPVIEVINGAPVDGVKSPARIKKVEEKKELRKENPIPAVRELSKVGGEMSAAVEETKSSVLAATTRMTLEEYTRQVEAIMETVKEEMLETEAILNARPGYDPEGWDYDDRRMKGSRSGGIIKEQPHEEETVEEVPEVEAKQEVGEEDLAVLEMDEPSGNEGVIRSGNATQVIYAIDEVGEMVEEEELDSSFDHEMDDDDSEYRL